MKISELIKDVPGSVRINGKAKELLEKMGSSIQKFLDEALDEKLEITKNLEIKERKK